VWLVLKVWKRSGHGQVKEDETYAYE
jgi:hypothetical protein